jgi:hypothetical protein
MNLIRKQINLMIYETRSKKHSGFRPEHLARFFDREIMDSGKLKKLIENDGVNGVTSQSFNF